jgi:hypothetical protein
MNPSFCLLGLPVTQCSFEERFHIASLLYTFILCGHFMFNMVLFKGDDGSDSLWVTALIKAMAALMFLSCWLLFCSRDFSVIS